MYKGKQFKNERGEIIEGESIKCEKSDFDSSEYDKEFNTKNFLDLIDFENEDRSTIPLNFKIDSYCEILRS